MKKTIFLVMCVAMLGLPSCAQKKNAAPEKKETAAAQPAANAGYTVKTLPTAITSNILQAIEKEYAGSVTLIDVWATWCPPCREELKHVQKQIIDRFAGEEFVFLPISRGEAAKTVKAFLQKNGYKFPAGLDPEQAIYKRYASNFIPRNFVIDKQGKIAYLSVGYDEKEFAELIDTVAAQLKK